MTESQPLEKNVEIGPAHVVRLLQLFEECGMDVVVDGGWGVDALLGRQTRPHKDLDIAIPHQDVPQLCSLLQARDFARLHCADSKDWNFVLENREGHQVDVHSYTFDAQGNHIYGIPYPADSLTGRGMIDGHPVKCISAEWAIQFRTQYEPKEKDFWDVRALCTKFAIALPPLYGKFIVHS